MRLSPVHQFWTNWTCTVFTYNYLWCKLQQNSCNAFSFRNTVAFEEMYENCFWPFYSKNHHAIVETSAYNNSKVKFSKLFYQIFCSSIFRIFDIVIKRSKSTQGHHFNNRGSPLVPDATYQVSKPLVNALWSKIFLNVLAYMGIVVMLPMWPETFGQICSLSNRGSTWNLVTFGQGADQEMLRTVKI